MANFKIKVHSVTGVYPAMLGMRYPLNSEDKCDTAINAVEPGPKDLTLLIKLCKAGASHRKAMRMIHVHATVAAPLIWWQHADTYKFIVTNSRSKMHKLGSRLLVPEDFYAHEGIYTKAHLDAIAALNTAVENWKNCPDDSQDKYRLWEEMQGLVPSSYIQDRMYDLNFETILAQWHDRKHHKLRLWQDYFNQLFAQIPHLEDLCRVSDK